MTPALLADGLRVRHGARPIVGPLSLRLDPGASLGLAGPSGAGKSTILRALLGLLPPELTAEGRAELLGTDIAAPGADLPALRARVSLVGQVPVVFPTSVLGNVVFGLRHHARLPRAALAARGEAALREAGLWDEVADRLDAPARQLSVGQRQRLCLARALALDPAALLLDEPTSALDAEAQAVVEGALTTLRSRRSLLVVSHDTGQLARLCDDVVEVRPAGRGGETGPAGGSGDGGDLAEGADSLRP